MASGILAYQLSGLYNVAEDITLFDNVSLSVTIYEGRIVYASQIAGKSFIYVPTIYGSQVAGTYSVIDNPIYCIQISGLYSVEYGLLPVYSYQVSGLYTVLSGIAIKHIEMTTCPSGVIATIETYGQPLSGVTVAYEGAEKKRYKLSTMDTTIDLFIPKEILGTTGLLKIDTDFDEIEDFIIQFNYQEPYYET